MVVWTAVFVGWGMWWLAMVTGGAWVMLLVDQVCYGLRRGRRR